MTITASEMRRVDNYVAEFVMNYPCYDTQTGKLVSKGSEEIPDLSGNDSAPSDVDKPLTDIKLSEVPYFTIDRSLSFIIIDKMEEKGWLFSCSKTLSDKWITRFSHKDSTVGFFSQAETSLFSVSICFSSLRAVGIKLDDNTDIMLSQGKTN